MIGLKRVAKVAHVPNAARWRLSKLLYFERVLVIKLRYFVSMASLKSRYFIAKARHLRFRCFSLFLKLRLARLYIANYVECLFIFYALAELFQKLSTGDNDRLYRHILACIRREREKLEPNSLWSENLVRVGQSACSLIEKLVGLGNGHSVPCVVA